MNAAAQAFLKAYHSGDVDGMMKSADVPFLAGQFRKPRMLKSVPEVRVEVSARIAMGKKLASRVMKTLTWEAALGGTDETATRSQLKAVTDVTGPGGGYAVLADTVRSGKGRTSLVISDTRLLVGIRKGQAKVVGILMDGN